MIVCALVCGLIARSVGLPALVGYLAAGFVLHELDATGGILLTQLAEMGVTLLLFSIGLKLKPADLLETKVWGTTIVHMLLSILVLAPLLFISVTALKGAGSIDWTKAATVAFALSFSSTVFAIQILQNRGEMASKHASLAIGVLLVQDVAAVAYIGASTGKIPEWTALGLLLLIPARGLILRVLRLSGHGDLFTLFGLALAILGAQLFEAVGVKGDLGALILGALLAGDRTAKELAKSLLQFKDLFLVGFFISIGLLGWPEPEFVALAIFLGLLAPLKAPLYFWLMTRFQAEPRIGFLSSTALSNHSEFGLIVIAIAAEAGIVGTHWTATLSLAIALSFLLSSTINTRSHSLYSRWRTRLKRFRSPKLERRRPDTEGVRIIVLGMGNIGTGVFDATRERHGDSVLGVDENRKKIATHRAAGRRVVDADASDVDFWSTIRLDQVEQILLVLTNHQENKLVGKLLRGLGYEGNITAIIRYRDQAEDLKAFDIECFDLFNEAGRGFAEHAERSRIRNEAPG